MLNMTLIKASLYNLALQHTLLPSYLRGSHKTHNQPTFVVPGCSATLLRRYLQEGIELMEFIIIGKYDAHIDMSFYTL